MSTPLTDRFDEALLLASRLHAGQRRKGTPVPYIAHLLAVTSLVIEDGGDEDQAIAALLHDAVEDQGGAATRAEILRRFGQRVVMIVDFCTDTDQTPKPPWRGRKEGHIGHVATAPPEALRVIVADKLHNARTLLADYRRHGEEIWGVFNGGREGTLWYYRAMHDAAARSGPPALLAELDRTLRELDRLMAGR
jgi:GTP pyrophosphokinase